MQIMVAKQTLRRVAELAHTPQHRPRIRPAVDQLPKQIQRVAACRKANCLEQALKRRAATLQIANTVK